MVRTLTPAWRARIAANSIFCRRNWVATAGKEAGAARGAIFSNRRNASAGTDLSRMATGVLDIARLPAWRDTDLVGFGASAHLESDAFRSQRLQNWPEFLFGARVAVKIEELPRAGCNLAPLPAAHGIRPDGKNFAKLGLADIQPRPNRQDGGGKRCAMYGHFFVLGSLQPESIFTVHYVVRRCQ